MSKTYKYRIESLPVTSSPSPEAGTSLRGKRIIHVFSAEPESGDNTRSVLKVLTEEERDI